MSRDSLTLSCPAKVNLALSVGSPDARSGMHSICSWMVTVDFSDTLTLTPADGDKSSFHIRSAIDAPSPQLIDWPIEKDMAYRAHAFLQEHTQRTLPVDLLLEKRIPSGAGLGGGSSDAAATLVGLNRLFNLGLTDQTLCDFGLKLGSDVGFLVMAQLGMRSAIVSGFGEVIEPSACAGDIHLVLIFPPCHCPTAEVYRCFDRLSPLARLGVDRVRSLAQAYPLPTGGPFNDLTKSALEVEPRLRVIREKLCKAVDRPVHVSGSGAAMFMVAQSAKEAEMLCLRVNDTTGLSAITTCGGV